MMTNKEMDMYDYLIECEYFTCAELNLVRCLVPGSWEEVINSAIYARYGYRDYEQFMEALAEENFEEDEDC